MHVAADEVGVTGPDCVVTCVYDRDVLKKLISLEALDQLVYKILTSKGKLIFF